MKHVAYGFCISQEPLLEQNLLDAFRASWQKQDIERQRYDLNSVSDWKVYCDGLQQSVTVFESIGS